MACPAAAQILPAARSILPSVSYAAIPALLAGPGLVGLIVESLIFEPLL